MLHLVTFAAAKIAAERVASSACGISFASAPLEFAKGEKMIGEGALCTRYRHREALIRDRVRMRISLRHANDESERESKLPRWYLATGKSQRRHTRADR
jgi:hypothetical protein